MELQLILRLWDPDKSFPNTKHPTKQVRQALCLVTSSSRALFGNLHIGRTSDGRKDGWTKLSIEVASRLKIKTERARLAFATKKKHRKRTVLYLNIEDAV